jgi:hypothetical protein
MNRYEVYLYEIRKYSMVYEVLANNQESAIKKAAKSYKKNKPVEDRLVGVDATEPYKCYLIETKVKRPVKKQKPKKHLGHDDNVIYHYSHVSCPGYPNCDISPMGCRLAMGDDVEEYGMRD